MSQAQFSLVKKTTVNILRHAAGAYVDSDWVEGVESIVPILANVHPFSDYQVMLLPEADRTKSWMWLFTSDLVRQKKEGLTGVAHGADRFIWEGDLYEIMKISHFNMSLRDHFEAKCCRVEITPN